MDNAFSLIASAPARHLFASHPDHAERVTGHSFPTQSAAQRLLQLLPEINTAQLVMHIGAGSGYFSAILAKLAGRVFAIERNSLLARTSFQRLNSLDINNVEVIESDVNLSTPACGQCDLIVATCILTNLDYLLPVLSEQGFLATLEDDKDHVSNLVLYQKIEGRLQRLSNLGWIDFSRRLADMVIDLGYVDESMLQNAKREVLRHSEPLISAINRLQQLKNRPLYEAIAKERQMVLLDYDSLIQQVDPALFRQFSRIFLDRSHALPVNISENQLLVVTDDPDADFTELAVMNGNGQIRLALLTPEDFNRLWTQLDVSTKAQSRAQSEQNKRNEEGYSDTKPNPINPYLVTLYDALLMEAISEHASDIHIECYQQRTRIRLRIDGDLQDMTHFQVSMADLAGLINVIKIRAELDIGERRLPQGGRSAVRQGQFQYDLRIQTQPSLHAEHIVIRLLKQTGRAPSMAELGMSARVTSMYQRLLHNPAGLVLVVGPTGSGKSTTLYAGLQLLAEDGKRKVITVEDPIEYSIDNIQQTRVRTEIGFDFPDALRAFVREDPDVILVGEIRDHATALEAARASQTGHLVLSTLHCNDAVDAIQRLRDLEIHPNSIASELLAVMAQRLAKRICTHCKQQVEPDAAILAELFPDEVPANFRCFAGKGCSRCNGRGTHGQVAVFEFMLVNTDIRNAISQQKTATELRWHALDAGMITMRDSALNLVVEGVIQLSELPKVLLQERMAPESRGGAR